MSDCSVTSVEEKVNALLEMKCRVYSVFTNLSSALILSNSLYIVLLYLIKELADWYIQYLGYSKQSIQRYAFNLCSVIRFYLTDKGPALPDFLRKLLLGVATHFPVHSDVKP